MANARGKGSSFTDIGRLSGVTKQATHRKYQSYQRRFPRKDESANSKQ